MIRTEWNPSEIRGLRRAISARPLLRALRKAGATALRDAKSEASKRVRARKRLKVKAVRQAMVVRQARARRIEDLEWSIGVRGTPVKLAAYPHRQVKRGVSVSVNRGQRTLVKGAFVAAMRTGHRGVFVRRGARRLPIRELLGSRPVDALLHAGEAEGVLRRAQEAFGTTFSRVLPMELDKERS